MNYYIRKINQGISGGKSCTMIKVTVSIRLCFLSVCLVVGTAFSDQWTWVYKKKFSSDEVKKNKDKKELICSQVDIPLFTQLIFSWNAHRPDKGFLTFALQVRDAHSGAWSDWHTMFDWGKTVQRSYQNEAFNGISDYIHVRLEMRPNKRADGFRIKASGNQQATLLSLKGFAVSCTDYHKFKSEVDNGALLSLCSVAAISGVPFYSQYALDHPRADSLCSPTAYSMLASFLLKKTIDPLDFARNVHDHGLDIYGSWPFNGAYAFERCHKKAWFWTIRCNSFTDVHAQLVRGIPAIVSIRGPLPRGAGDYKNGHLVVVVGWDQIAQEVVCHDPAFNDDHKEHVRYKLHDFLHAWEKSRRLMYYVELRA